MREFPYDRPSTTMAVFEMCPACADEYTNPGERRFHAQPNACAECGPSLRLVAANACEEGKELHFDLRASSLTILHHVRRLLYNGRIVALKGLGGFLLACDAHNDQAVQTLRQRKKRSDKPFALMVRDIPSVERLCVVSEAEREALLGPRCPIVILQRRSDCPIQAAVAPGNDTLGVMLPYTPLHHLLLKTTPGRRRHSRRW
jgi:hydrogenase maturation protein HypF